MFIKGWQEEGRKGGREWERKRENNREIPQTINSN